MAKKGDFRRMKFNLKNFPEIEKSGYIYYSEHKCLYECKAWVEGFEAELREKDTKFATEYISYETEDIGILIKEILGK